jgi:hypothetical protein
MELPSRDTTTAPPSLATNLDSVRRLRHAFGIAPLGRDNPVNYSQPHPREAQLTRVIYLSRESDARTILAILRQREELHETKMEKAGRLASNCQQRCLPKLTR